MIPLEPTSSKIRNDDYRTRGARGGSKLNSTLHESSATALLRSATPKKNVPCFSDLSATDFFF